MKFCILLLALVFNMSTWSQVTTTKPPGPDDQIEVDIDLKKEIDNFVYLVKERAATYQKSKLDFTLFNFIKLSSYLFLENSINPPRKDCCDPNLVHLSPILKHLLTPIVLEKIDLITHNKIKFENYLIQELKLSPSDATLNYEGYRNILKLNFAR